MGFALYIYIYIYLYIWIKRSDTVCSQEASTEQQQANWNSTRRLRELAGIRVSTLHEDALCLCVHADSSRAGVFSAPNSLWPVPTVMACTLWWLVVLGLQVTLSWIQQADEYCGGHHRWPAGIEVGAQCGPHVSLWHVPEELYLNDNIHLNDNKLTSIVADTFEDLPKMK